MKDFTKYLLTLLLLGIACVVNAFECEIDQRFTSIEDLVDQPFCIVNEAEGMAFFGSTQQNLGYDVYSNAFLDSNSGYQFKIESTTVEGGYLLLLQTSKGEPYSIWGNPGYLNTQSVDGNCSFILGLADQYGTDLENGALWELQYDRKHGWSLRNFGTGLYLSTNDAAKYEDPTYFTFCTIRKSVDEKPLFEDGSYYLYNIGMRKYLSAGSTWGTHAVVDDTGLDYGIVFTEGKYTMESQVSNGGNSHYLSEEWNDGNEYGWTFEEVETGVYTISNGKQFLTAQTDGLVEMTDDVTEASMWMLKTLSDRLDDLANATIDAPVNATFLIKGANFSRNDSRNGQWMVSDDCYDYTLSGGNNVNNVAAFYYTTGTISQELSNIPAGNYSLTAQGFYYEKSDDISLPYFFANSEVQSFLLRTGSEESLEAASESFANSLYTVEPIYVVVGDNEGLTIGVKNESNTDSWGAFDNFQLFYHGLEGDIDDLKPVAVDMTDIIVNSDFEQGELGWIKEAVNGGNVRVGGSNTNMCYEAWNNESFDVYQSVAGLPVGVYEISVQGFNRYLGGDNAYRAYRNGNTNVPVYIYMNDNLTPFKNIFEEPVFDSEFYTGSTYFEGNYTGAYFPRSMETASTAFSVGMYQNNTYGAVFDENEGLRIGVKGNTSAGDDSWAIWDNFKLIFWGKAPSKVYAALIKAIYHANEVLTKQKLTDKGFTMLQESVNEAMEAKNGKNGEVMFAVLQNIYKVTANVLKNEVLKQETISIDSYDYVEVSTINGDLATLTFSRANGSYNPYGYPGYVRVYSGNTLNVSSEEDIVDVTFSSCNGYDAVGSVDIGVFETNHWYGNANNLTFTNTNGYQWQINSITITYDSPSDSVIFERLQNQIQLTESALASLVYENVPGKEYVEHLVELGRSIELTETLDKYYVKSLTKEMHQQTEWMVMVDGHYQQIASRIAELEDIVANNSYVNQDVLTEATAYCDELTIGLSEGKYSWDDFSAIYSKLNDYANILREIYLVLQIDEPGTLGDSILARVENFTDVIGLRVSGNLNTSDMANLKSRLTNVKYLDLGETSLYYIASEQFYNHTNLQKIVLPKGLNRIDSYAFYGCTNLQDTEFPASLRTIDSYAFYNCAFENVVVPEGVTTINQCAFACSDNYTSYYDENGNYISNYYYAKLLKVNLPSTLRTLGNDAFAYQRNLSSVYISDGLSAIPSYAFFYCSGLTNLRLPATLNTIDYEAFYSCSSLKRVLLPEGITTVGNNAFSYCSNLEEVILPTTLTSLNYSFSNCNKLTRMTCKAIVPPSANNRSILGGQEYMCMLTVPNLSINVYKQTSYWDQFNIVGTDILPQNITIAQDYRLSWNNNSLMDGSELVSNGNLEGSDYSNFVTQKLDENGSRYKETSSVVEGDGVDGSYGIMIEADPITESSYEWDTQFFVQLNRSLPAGTRYHVEFDYKATNECDVPTQTHASPGDYIHWQMFPVLHFTSEWQHYDALGEITSEQSLEGKQMQTIAFNLAVNEEATQFFFDNVKFTIIYKPNVRIENTGRLEVTGNSTLSASSFTMVYDENLDYQYNYGDRSSSASAISASLINKANVRADNVTIDLWTHANKWTFFSMPFDVKVSNIGEQNPGTPFVIRKYDGQKRANSEMYNTWVDMTSDSILHAGEGYIIQSPNRDNNYYNGFWFTAEQNINKNRIFANEDVEVQLAEYQSEFPQNRSWNLIGNPYPCYYDTRAIDVTTPITVWNVYNSNYQAYSPVDDNLILRPGEAFFIQRPVDQTSITFLKEGRQTNYNVRNVNYFAGARQSDMTAQRSVFNLVLGNGELSDRTRFVINSEAQMGYEIHCDASKFMSDDAIMQLYTIEQGVRLSINERPMAKGELTLGVMFSKKGTYTISLDTQVNNEVWLVDRLSGTEILLDEVGYSFEAEAGTFDDRFVVRLGNGDVTGINTIGISEGTSKIYNLNGIRVEQPTKGLYINNGKKVVVK